MEHLVEQFLRSPKMEIYLQQINAARAEESVARQRFLDEIVEDDKAEFINGQIAMHSPVQLAHANCSSALYVLVKAFVQSHTLGKVGYEKLMVSLTRNDYEPDLCFWKTSTSATFAPDQMRFPAPDWIVEVLSPSTEAIDRGIKFEDYAAHGVAEYWIIDSEKQTVEQYELANGIYELVVKSTNGLIRSKAISGFDIPIVSIFNETENMKTLRAILSQ